MLWSRTPNPPLRAPHAKSHAIRTSCRPVTELEASALDDSESWKRPVGIMENKMETTIMVYIGIILGLYWGYRLRVFEG